MLFSEKECVNIEPARFGEYSHFSCVLMAYVSTAHIISVAVAMACDAVSPHARIHSELEYDLAAPVPVGQLTHTGWDIEKCL